MTPQQKIKELLEKALKAKKIDVFGSHIIVEAWSESAARAAFRLLHQFCEDVSQPKKTIAYNKENEGTSLCPSTHFTWLVHARI
jgi:hypothetical protein